MFDVLKFFEHHTPEHQPSIEILAALSAIPRTVVSMARGEAEPFFYVCPLATGIGKSVTLAHTVRLLRELDDYQPLGVVLCANRLDQIEVLVQDMHLEDREFAVYVAAGENNDKFHHMGLGRHRASEAPILITTHAMLLRRLRERRWADAPEFFFQDFPRTIRIWDEAMLPGQPITLTVPALQGVLARTERLPDFYRELNQLVDTIREAEDGALLYLPDFADLTTREDLMEAVEGRDLEVAEFLWCLSGRTVRVRSGGDNYANTILDYTEALPDDVKPMLVLDASAAVRATYTQQKKHRNDLKLLPGSGLKKYRNVTFHVLDRGGGKIAFRNHYEEYLAAIGEVINQAPGKVLAVHFNDLPNFRADLDRFLTEGTRADHEKIQCLTWGRHDATNEYRECTTVILAGTPFYRSSQYEALGRAAAAKRAPEEYPKADQDDIALGELRHHVLQAASRGSLRLCNIDQAKTCDVWLITDPRNGLREELETIFPEVEVVDWDAAEHLKIVQRRLSSQAMEVAEVVREWVENAKPTDPPLFFTDVRKRLGIKDISNFNKLVASKGFQTFLDEVGLLVRNVLNRKAFLRPTMFDLCYEYWFNLNTDFDALEARLYELKEAGVEGPEYDRVYERFIDVATQLGLAH